MTPFLQLRFWWNRASEASRLATTISLLLVVALVGYIALPTNSDDAGTAGVAAGAPATGDAAPRPADGAADVAPGEGGTVGSDNPGAGTAPAADGALPSADAPAAGSTTAGPTAAGGKQCASAPAGTPGVTDKEITIAITLVALAGAVGNSAVGIASSDEFKRIGEAVRQDINAKGGVQCRQLAFKYYDVNPLSQDAQRSACLQVAQDRPLLVADIAGFAFPAGAYGCVPQQKIPLIASATLLRSEIQRFQPYVAAPNADAETQLRTMVLGLRDRKWFDAANGFKKLGVLYDDCQPEANRIHDAALAEVGVTGDKLTKYTYSCPVTGLL
jgi:hypothetical protein